MSSFNEQIERCGLSTRGAANLLNVRFDTVRNWKYGKAKVPDGVMKCMKEYAEQAERIFKND